MLNQLMTNEDGFIISAELVLVLTIAVIGMIVGLSHVALAVNQELNDIGQAIGSLNQSYNFTGFQCCACPCGGFTSQTSGSSFVDTKDVCDRHSAEDMVTCDATPESNHGGHGGGHHGRK